MEAVTPNYKNQKLEREFLNPVYNTITKAITATIEKHGYPKYSAVKLIDAIYTWDYTYLTTESDYRMQARLLDEYFTKQYKHRLITFELVKTINTQTNEANYNLLKLEDITFLTNTFKKEIPVTDLCTVFDLLKQKNYDELMTIIEKSKPIRHSLATIYDKTISKKRQND